ncbi:hypothetical protein J2X92_000148 [Variovorax paradoxus]|nr:hypothetical protein [Variovorax paradoxus]
MSVRQWLAVALVAVLVAAGAWLMLNMFVFWITLD